MISVTEALSVVMLVTLISAHAVVCQETAQEKEDYANWIRTMEAERDSYCSDDQACGWETYADVYNSDSRLTLLFMPNRCQCNPDFQHCIRKKSRISARVFIHYCRPLSEIGIICPDGFCPFQIEEL